MRRAYLFMALFAAVSNTPSLSAANAQDAPAASTKAWQRAVNPDGSFSVEMPCGESEIQQKQEGASVGMGCPTDDIFFGAVLTSDGLNDERPEAVSDFDGMLLDAKNDPDTGRLEVLDLAGMRTFRVWGNAARPFALAQISERRPGELIVLAAMVDPEGPADAVDWPAAKKLAFRYFSSLTVLGL